MRRATITEKVFPGVFKRGERFFTKSLTPGFSVYDEKRLTEENVEYREWDAFKSKLSAALRKGLKTFPIKPGNTVLYLGAAQGTTASHVADVVGENGIVVCVEVAAKPFEKLLRVAEHVPNMVPVLADANKPGDYAEYLENGADVVFEDVSQRNQAEILLKNCERFLKPDGFAIIAIKAMSIDMRLAPEKVFEQQLAQITTKLTLVESVRLEPFEKHHLLAVFKKGK